MFDQIIEGKAEVVRQVEDVMLVVGPVDTLRNKEYNCPDKMQEERKEHRRNTENQTQDFNPNSNKKGSFFTLSSLFHLARRPEHIYNDSGATSTFLEN